MPNSVAGVTAENEGPVPGVGSESTQGAADADRPRARGARADVFYIRHGKTRPAKQIHILGLIAEPRQPSLLADRLREVADVPWAWGAVRQPRANDQSLSGAQVRKAFAKQRALSFMCSVSTIDRIRAVEAGGGKAVGEPVPHLER
jgi:hypothetical protein